jgi:hypothetical protein
MAAKKERWFCSFCSEAHVPDLGTQIDARYATGLCGGVKRPLVRDEQEALRLAKAGGKLREKGVPLGGGERSTQPNVADTAATRAIQGQR